MTTSDPKRFGGIAALCIAAMVLSGSARADTAEQRAVTLFEAGRKLAREGRCAEAITPLHASIRHAEGVGPLLNLGNCYETLGKLASAHRYFTRAREVAASRHDPRQVEAAQRAASLEKDLPILLLRIPPSIKSSIVEVRLDGESVTRDRWDVPIPVDSGAHEIEVVAPPHPKHKESVTVRGRGERVEWTLPEPRPSPERAPAAALAPVPGESGGRQSLGGKPESSTQRTLGLVTGGVGLAGVAAGAIFGVLSISAHSAVTGRCPSYPRCSSADRADLDDMNAKAELTGTISTIGFIAGGALLAGGAALFFTAPPSRPRVER